VKLKLFRSKEKKTGVAKIKIRQVRSGIACPIEMRETLKALGLGRINRVSERVDSPAVRGMIAKIPHLVEVVTE
jgi:large subunit ribosomal protein L30